MTWRLMTEHAFPWPVRRVVVAAFHYESPSEVELIRCRVGERGAFFAGEVGMLSLHEDGFFPIAWRVDDTPERDDEKWPPLPDDYLTRAS